LDPHPNNANRDCWQFWREPHKYSSKEERDEHLAFLLEWVEEYYSRSDDMSLVEHKRVFERYDGPKQWLSALTDPIKLIDETP